MYRMRGRHAGIAFAKPTDHAATGDNGINHIAKCLRLLTARLIRQRLFAALQQHVTDRQRPVNAQTHG
ncbi:hypothetical protein D3C87_1995200 [compost metagenome]